MNSTFFWFIENYSVRWRETEGLLVSPVFASPELQDTSWILSLYPLNENDGDLRQSCAHLERLGDNKQRDTCLFLKRNDVNGPDTLPLHYQISVFKKGSISYCSNKRQFVSQKNVGAGWQCSIFSQDLLSVHEPSDTLMVRCELWDYLGDRQKATTLCARTRIGTEHISFVHVVNDFNTLKATEMKIPQVHSCSKQGVVIASSLYFTDELCCDKQPLILEIMPNSPSFILYKCTVYLLDSFGYFIKCAVKYIPFNVNRQETEKISLSLTKDIISKMNDRYMSGDKLTLLCECIFYTGIEFNEVEDIGGETSPTSIIGCMEYLEIANSYMEDIVKCDSVTDNLKGLYQSEFLADVEIKTQTKTFSAHKIILCARSPVMKQMFSNDMVEKISNSIQIDDLKDKNVQQLLHFLYTDKVENLQWDDATALHYAADKYDIKKLKLMSSSFLVGNLTSSTAAELLYLGYKHNDRKLLKIAVRFVLEHEVEVFRSEKFHELAEVDIVFALKMMRMKYRKTDTEEEFYDAFLS